VETYTKDPNDVRSVTLDLSAYLGTDTIATDTWTVPTGITKDSDSNTTTSCTGVFSGGTAGQTYVVSVRIVSSGGAINDRTADFSFAITVVESSAYPSEPLTLDDAKTHLRVTSDDDDTYIQGLISAAHIQVENDTGLTLMRTTKYWYMDRFPQEIWLPGFPLISVTSITYLDGDGATQTVSSADYVVDINWIWGRVMLAYGDTWPATRSIKNSVTVTYVAGYSDVASIPASLMHAMKLLISHWYEFRIPVITGTIQADLSLSYRSIVAHYPVSFPYERG
jgi:uncharacterized phiE125 gp8 family phage protein